MDGVDQKQMGPRRLPVMLPYPFAGPFDYRVPPEIDAVPGDVVLVPLNGRETVGVVWDDQPGPAAPERKLKPIAAVLDTPPMRLALRAFIDWMAAYTLAPPGEVMAMALRVVSPPAPTSAVGWCQAAPPPPLAGGGRGEGAAGEGREAVAARDGCEAGAAGDCCGAKAIEPASTPPRITEARRRVLAALEQHEPQTTGDLARAAGVGRPVIQGMANAGLLVPVTLSAEPCFALPDPDYPGLGLSPQQAEAASVLRAGVAARSFGVTLLDGVTGSGKTEVYLEAIAESLRQGRQALVLLPEIALSSQWLERFERRFGVAPAVWHSDLSLRMRRITWREVAAGRALVVVGARSALFLPFPELGLIVVDEEHETAFKQEEGVVYHARDMAVVRGRFEQAPVILVSATPSLETVANVEAGRYHRLTLPNRHGGAALPAVAAIDLRQTPPDRGRFLAPRLVEAIGETLARGEQAMLFLNRRGYAPLTLCRQCGHRMQCPHCTAWLVEHRARRLLQCHHCGHAIPIPEACPACGAAHSLTPVGPGVERITEEAAVLFPAARRLVMASDTLPGPHAAAEASRAIAAREVDLIIGTQIVAKGWHFPYLTLVGVVDADLGLAGGDLRAAERTVQLLHQVAGRAGRAEAPGRVMLQTFAPEHPVMRALVEEDLAGFIAREAEQRRPGHWPPYGRLAALIVSADAAHVADHVARELGRTAPGGPGVTVLGPAPAPLSVLRGRHRRRLLLKARRDIAVQPLLREWLGKVAVPRGARVEVDVDPVSFL